MAFEEVISLNFDKVVALGGLDRKTGKPNLKQIEGFYIGSKKIADKKKSSGFSFIHGFQTKDGTLGVWGKTDLDKALLTITPGVMTRATHVGMVETPNGEMYKYKVEVDKTNCIEVSIPDASSSSLTEAYDVEDVEDEVLDEVVAARPVAPRKVGTVPSAERQAEIQALLSRKR